LIKKIVKWIGNLIFVCLVIAVVLSLCSRVQSIKNPNEVKSILGIKAMPVLSGSMEPFISTGDMIVATNIDPQDIKKDDVITYRINQNTLVTHRVIEITNENGRLMFKTKGDANNVEDQAFVSSEQLVGRLIFNIPKGGYLANFIKTPVGFILIILLPIIFLILGELKNILSETKNKNHKKVETKDSMEI